jgi:hypothetical protein
MWLPIQILNILQNKLINLAIEMQKTQRIDLHVSLVFAYSKKTDRLVLANNITNNGVE